MDALSGITSAGPLLQWLFLLLCAVGFMPQLGLSLSEEVLSYRPLIIRMRDFASREECAEMLKLIDRCHDRSWDECKEQQSRLHSKKGSFQNDGSSARPLRNSTSFTLTLEGEMNEVVDRLVQRSHRVARHPITHGEGVQIASYHAGEYYGFHHDSLSRRATVLLYLTTVPEGGGGETIFPLVRAPEVPLDKEAPLPPAVTGRHRESLDFKVLRMEPIEPYCESDFYLKLRPEAGTGVLFFNYGPDYSLDEYAIHGACPIRHGHKAIFQRWMRFAENSLYAQASEAVKEKRVSEVFTHLLKPKEENTSSS
eukprot:CAMPEP_0178394414 /NCGR_PEP_ID=MMETSP0689_2-20121128/12694_1 /TAXON_ID=160604 /ORGANISM="Amphidinium massartii, Strain CS-259" /LENGTH=309 /DNA_ID=CAMNT_0020015043 /DNA_START=59 /DNA_END=985 /DNA_ORIENTATION=-